MMAGRRSGENTAEKSDQETTQDVDSQYSQRETGVWGLDKKHKEVP